MNKQSKLDLSKAKTLGEEEIKEEEFAVLVVNLMSQIAQSLNEIVIHTGRMANVLEEQLEMDRAELEEEKDDPIEPEVS